MKYFAALLATAAVGAFAGQTLSDFLPECSVKCLADALAAATPCAANDLDCLCIADNYRATYTSGVACVLETCGSDVAVGKSTNNFNMPTGLKPLETC
ncbi:hypothetical protein B0T19DRAFT_432000 [Cercophora scortea]|uniref:CFEM domain-containing protein n=1 Tax=Cercophora scortea TaxID=314031 RepID=A0AAE0IA52_9PEZI|nr:hypothetical protein B0T19DRAFT_432000 [Cercophora scortea]